ncbi:phosphatase PAP2 family protein [Billgrantia diversa]|uniref:phosphatase PAP2 family protein n=1 Tax=Halomonas sp. MCCC 1A13316 TaxID=2733487 RepID=UPI0018A3AEA1|nr:phosphatase PAP2 family protein [Halomonas sp. MCCC 1A13316]QOR38053.1 phosphatase PAP2 family protein [Halomonas sp. MCCC 1A13316]
MTDSVSPSSNAAPRVVTAKTSQLTPWQLLALSWCGFLALVLAIAWLELDFRLADVLYRWQGDDWALREHILLEGWLHRGGRQLSQWLGGLVILALLASHVSPKLLRWRRALWYLFLAVASATFSVAAIKQLVTMECPWDLARYGGKLPFIGLLEARPADLPDTACFPAGHASAGYAWVALYFFFSFTLPRLRWAGLTIGLGLGLLFGVAQQLRGAHFLSHDLWTLMLCWTISVALAGWLLVPEQPIAASLPEGA